MTTPIDRDIDTIDGDIDTASVFLLYFTVTIATFVSGFIGFFVLQKCSFFIKRRNIRKKQRKRIVNARVISFSGCSDEQKAKGISNVTTIFNNQSWRNISDSIRNTSNTPAITKFNRNGGLFRSLNADDTTESVRQANNYFKRNAFRRVVGDIAAAGTDDIGRGIKRVQKRKGNKKNSGGIFTAVLLQALYDFEYEREESAAEAAEVAAAQEETKNDDIEQQKQQHRQQSSKTTKRKKEKEPTTYMSMLLSIQKVLQEHRYAQIPQISTSHPIILNKAPFRFFPDAEKDCFDIKNNNDNNNNKNSKTEEEKLLVPSLLLSTNHTPTKRAVLIGISYNNQLIGTHNDVYNVKKYLKKVHGFKEENITCLIDDDKHQQPNRDNIINAYNILAEQSKNGDYAFCHFSGHGGRLVDEDGDEINGFDETLIPCDYIISGHIRDDEIYKVLVEPLPKGVALTTIFDSCHSGSVMDLPYEYTSKGMMP